MKWTAIILAAIGFFAACSVVHALYEVSDKGEWPTTWPKELEPLRKQATTLVGPMAAHEHYLIPFTNREQFEAAWPYFLKVKTKGAPIILVRGPKTDFMELKPAGLLIHAPPKGTDRRVNREQPIPAQDNPQVRWMNTTYFELAMDGKIVDLNRIPLPPDTPIIDERFKGGNKPVGDAKPQGHGAAERHEPVPGTTSAVKKKQ